MPTTTMAASLAAPPSAFDTGLSGETAAASMSLNGASVATSNITVVGGSNEEAKVAIPFPELEGKDPIEQLEILNALLEKETRIKEGAENLLKMPLAVRPLTLSSARRLVIMIERLGCTETSG